MDIPVSYVVINTGVDNQIRNHHIQATLLNPDMCNPDFRPERTDWKVPVHSYTYISYTHNPDFA